MALGVYRYNDYTTIVNSEPEATTLEELASIIQDGGGTAEVVAEIQRTKFKKNCWNMAFATSSTLTG